MTLLYVEAPVVVHYSTLVRFLLNWAFYLEYAGFRTQGDRTNLAQK
jgi:hypothetical protein